VFIELTEALDCPVCQKHLGLVAFVRELRERRVLEGHLGCPECLAEFPIREGGIDLTGLEEEAGNDMSADAGVAVDCPDERAIQIAALLGVQEHSGARLLLDEGLAACATAVVGWGERIEVLTLQPALVSDDASEDPLDGESPGDAEASFRSAPGVTPLAGAPHACWPIRPHALRGVALLGGSPERLREAERVLARDGRLVVLEPVSAVLDGVAELGFEILAAEARALVGARR
jgi:uncharacterized protein YbaR (Trm112 family)